MIRQEMPVEARPRERAGATPPARLANILHTTLSSPTPPRKMMPNNTQEPAGEVLGAASCSRFWAIGWRRAWLKRRNHRTASASVKALVRAYQDTGMTLTDVKKHTENS